MFNFWCYVPYIALSLVHIYACAQNKQKLRATTKCFLMPLLALAYYWCGGRIVFVFVALFFGLLGDIVLLKPQEYREKVIGSTLFAIGHVFYLLTIVGIIGINGFKPWNFIVIAICAAIGFVIYYKNKEPIIKKMRVSCLGYFILLGGMVGLAIAASSVSIMGLLPAAGYVLFIISDALLVNQWFTVGDPYPQKDKWVMITYCMAQLLLVMGFVFM